MNKSFVLFFLILFLPFTCITACTGISLTAKDGSSVSGRTVEFGAPLEFTAAVIPRGFSFVGKTPSGDGLNYKSKYAVVGTYCFNEKVLMDGMNEKGLTAAAFYFPGYAEYASINPSNQNKALSPIEFPHWILTQFASIDEVKSALSSILIAPTVSEGWGLAPPPMHYIIYDRSGKSIVVEPIKGSLTIYDNPIGTITNSPTFDWHLTNLCNFINLSTVNASPITLRGLTLTQFGQGSGLVGLPGDFTPPSRFVRATLFSCTTLPATNSEESVYQTFHILNQFDIPYGSVRQNNNGTTYFDYTMLTSVKNPQTLKYYYKSYKSQVINYIDLNQFDLNSKVIKTLKLVDKPVSNNISSMLQ